MFTQVKIALGVPNPYIQGTRNYRGGHGGLSPLNCYTNCIKMKKKTIKNGF